MKLIQWGDYKRQLCLRAPYIVYSGTRCAAKHLLAIARIVILRSYCLGMTLPITLLLGTGH